MAGPGRDKAGWGGARGPGRPHIEEMRAASKSLQFEKAARLRDEIKAMKSLNLRGDLEKHAQPEVFYVDPRKGLKGLKKILKLESIPRTLDGVDIAHILLCWVAQMDWPTFSTPTFNSRLQFAPVEPGRPRPANSEPSHL